ncbi:MAG: hypothetical protein ACJ75B_20400 [Flavisolibacter sp.]
MKLINAYLLIIVVICFTSCFESSEIYFDVKTQSIISCNLKGIKQVYITNDSTADNFRKMFCDSSIDLPSQVNLNKIESGYCVFKGWNNTQIATTELRLDPLSHYTIERVQGDASAYKIKVTTDVKGKIIQASKENCK